MNHGAEKLPKNEGVNFPIDLVYTWVDGNNANWQLEKKKYLAASANELHPNASSSSRFESRDELKYSLRSVSDNTDFVRNIYIVTNGIFPKWLNTNHEKIHLINHGQIFRNPSDSLPTFNSHAIESNLHRIPGLSEHFIYLNDDIFFHRKTFVSDLFTHDGKPRVLLSSVPLKKPDEKDHPFYAAQLNSKKIVESIFSVSVADRVLHGPYPQLKSTLEKIELLYGKELENTERRKFRSYHDISLPASLAIDWGFAQGTAVRSLVMSSTVATSGKLGMYLALVRHYLFRDRQYLCINDADKKPGKYAEKFIKCYLEWSFPQKSEFEK